MSHSVFSASGAHRWMPCPGSIQMCRDIPNEGSAAAMEGSAAHCVATQLHAGSNVVVGMLYIDAEDRLVMPGDPILQETFSPIVAVDEEMIEHAQAYVDYCNLIPGQHFTEVRVSYEVYIKDGYGTSDHIVVGKDSMDVIDLKYGKGVVVHAERNEQGLLYALGAFLGLAEFESEFIKTVRVHIFQPRRDHISVAEYTIEEVLAFAEVAQIAAELALSDNPPLVPGEKQCQFCPAQAVCPARAEQALRTACQEFGTLDDALNTLVVDPDLLPVKPVQPLSVSDIAALLSVVDSIASWCTAVREKAHLFAVNGHHITGHKLVESLPHRKWSDTDGAKDFLEMAGYDEDDFSPRGFISPAQAEKLIGKKLAATLEFAITRPAGKAVLVRADDPRPEVTAFHGQEFTPVETD